jgi:uncharacterized phage-associated protein
MSTVRDVAAYILRKQGPMSAMKLQKLSYYSQAWHLVWEDKPLFDDRIEAWANGPVAPALYRLHRGHFRVTEDLLPGDIDVAPDEASTIEGVLRFYAGKSAWDLSNLTHSEDPWRAARSDVPDGAPSTSEITPASMAEYYGSLTS